MVISAIPHKLVLPLPYPGTALPAGVCGFLLCSNRRKQLSLMLCVLETNEGDISEFQVVVPTLRIYLEKQRAPQVQLGAAQRHMMWAGVGNLHRLLCLWQSLCASQTKDLWKFSMQGTGSWLQRTQRRSWGSWLGPFWDLPIFFPQREQILKQVPQGEGKNNTEQQRVRANKI